MYIKALGSAFTLSNTATDALVSVEDAAYCLKGENFCTLPTVQNGSAFERVWQDDLFSVKLTALQKSDTLFYFHRTWKNCSSTPKEFETRFRIGTKFVPTRYLIPCVNVNGNEFGAGSEPKGLTKDGKPWIFAYDRVSIPSCTLTESKDVAVSLFVSGESEVSLTSSCSLARDDDTGYFYQDIYHPVIEAPLTYAYRDKYTPEYRTYLTLAPGESFESGFYLSVSHPRWEHFGICDTLDCALDLFSETTAPKIGTEDAVWANSITFAKSLLSDYKGKKGFIIGFLPDGKGGFAYRKDNCFELAWCGQNILFARMFVEDYIRTGNRDSLDTALSVVDTRVELCTAKSGLIASQLRDFENLEEASADTCNLGYGAYELLRLNALLSSIGIERKSYFDTAKGVCDFFVDHFSPRFGFGKQWRLDGTCLDEGGTIGAFLLCPLAKMYELTGEEKYLETAKKAMHFYMERDLDRFICTAGALDTCCVDKETSAPIIMSGILLYELTKDSYYLTCAKKAAYYFTSWMFHYQPAYASSSEITKYGVCVRGLTSVSAQHHHLDMYAGIVVPYLRKLAYLTGEEMWHVRSEMMWRAVLQYIGDGELTIHGVRRPVGSQNEALFQSRWTFGGEDRGTLNDWLVAWPCAFRLSVLARQDF